MKHRFIWIMPLLAMLSAGSMAWADSDHKRARALLEQGKILPLSEIMKQASSHISGKILEIELEEEDGIIVYEIEFLSEHDVVMEMFIDARTGQLISVEEH